MSSVMPNDDTANKNLCGNLTFPTLIARTFPVLIAPRQPKLLSGGKVLLV
jgi:hypothetical protein